MAKGIMPPLLCWRFAFLVALLITPAQGFFGGGSKRSDEASRGATIWQSSGRDPRQESSLSSLSSLSSPFTTALSELEEIMSKPVCYQIAARLLVTNCEVLDKQDEATVYTDTGRAAADFVASFALSLAICDLERGSFEIPSSCFKFREPTLASLPLPTHPQLHVTTAEIDECLANLKHSAAAWNTWISYKHKALLFCEAARADNAKDQSIRANREITQILARLATQVPDEMDARLQSLNDSFQDANLALGQLKPQLQDVSTGLAKIESLLEAILIPNAKKSADSITAARDEADSLKEVLAMLITGIHARNSEMEEHREIALRTSAQRTKEEFGAIMIPLAAAVASTISLQNEIEQSQLRMAEMARQQESIEFGIRRLDDLTDTLLIKQQKHLEYLDRVDATLQGIQDIASPILSFLQRWLLIPISVWSSRLLKLLCAVVLLVVGIYLSRGQSKELTSCQDGQTCCNEPDGFRLQKDDQCSDEKSEIRRNAASQAPRCGIRFTKRDQLLGLGFLGLVGLVLLICQHYDKAIFVLVRLGEAAGNFILWISQSLSRSLSRAQYGSGITLHVRKETIDNSTIASDL